MNLEKKPTAPDSLIPFSKLSPLPVYFLLLFLTSLAATAEIIITIEQPEGDRIREPATVAVRIQSTFEIQSVVAEIADRRATLPFSHLGYSQLPVFMGTVDVSGLPSARYDLKIIATDALNNSQSITKNIALDRPPILQIPEEIGYEAVVRTPLLPINIACIDDTGCRVEVYWSPDAAPIYKNGILDLRRFDHSSAGLRIVAFENVPYVSWVDDFRAFYVESSQRLIDLVNAPGGVIDFDSERVLFRKENGFLGILDRSSGNITTVVEAHATPNAFLTPGGAVYVSQPGDATTSELFEFPGGSLGNPSSAFKAAGPYLVWSVKATLYRRNVVTRQTDVISTQAGNNRNDVTANGDVAWWSNDFQVFLNGRQMSSSQPNTRNVFPGTDGKMVVWLRNREETPGVPETYIVMNDGSGEIVLTKNLATAPSPGPQYIIAGGWIAYTDLGASGQLHVWLRSPTGQRTQLSFFSTSNIIDALNDRGEVIFTNNKHRYLNKKDLGIFSGQPVFRDGQWYVRLGRRLFALDTSVPMTVQRQGEFLVINGSGTLQTSTDLLQWSDIGPIESTLRLPLNSFEKARFYRTKE